MYQILQKFDIHWHDGGPSIAMMYHLRRVSDLLCNWKSCLLCYMKDVVLHCSIFFKWNKLVRVRVRVLRDSILVITLHTYVWMPNDATAPRKCWFLKICFAISGFEYIPLIISFCQRWPTKSREILKHIEFQLNVVCWHHIPAILCTPYMTPCIWSTLVQVIACCLFDTKPVHETMLINGHYP